MYYWLDVKIREWMNDVIWMYSSEPENDDDVLLVNQEIQHITNILNSK